MSYFTFEEATHRYPKIATKGGTDIVTSAFVAQIGGQIDTALAARYTVPFSPVPAVINDLAIDLCYIKMFILEESTKVLWEMWQKRIEALQKGTEIIAGTDGALTINTAVIDKEYHSAFGPDDPINWQTDTDALTDAEDSRIGD